VIEEFILSFTHSMEMPTVLPGVTPTGRKVELPHVVVMGIEDDKVHYEHIYWDQGSLDCSIQPGLPVTGAEQARKLLDPTLPSNELIERAKGANA
jgi:carboxymethylenebutenolidase